MKKRLISGILFSIVILLASCGGKGERHLQMALDENNFLKGDLKGYVSAVYKINYMNNTYEILRGDLFENKVYLKDGEYTIEFEGKTYVLYEAKHPIDLFGNGSTILKWQLDSNLYIEDVPDGY